jgi:hypothetical protein
MSNELVSPLVWIPVVMICCIAVGFVAGLYIFEKDKCSKCGKIL